MSLALNDEGQQAFLWLKFSANNSSNTLSTFFTAHPLERSKFLKYVRVFFHIQPHFF